MSSSSDSAIARNPAKGVLRSWDTHATSSRRDASSARSRCREAPSRALVLASSSLSAASSAVGGSMGAANCSPVPNARVASRSARLPATTRRPRMSATASETRPATRQTTRTTWKSWLDRNIASAVATIPATRESTAISATAASETCRDRWRSSHRARSPITPTPPAAAAAINATCMVLFMSASGSELVGTPLPQFSRDLSHRLFAAVGRVEPVAHPPHGGQEQRVRRIGLDLLPQPADVDGHRRLVAEGPSPHFLEQLGAVEGSARVGEEEREQVELSSGQLQRLTALLGAVGEDVDLDIADAQHPRARRRGIRRPTHPPEHGLDAQHQLSGAERLCHVVVRAELETQDPVALRAESGQHDHRHRPELT